MSFASFARKFFFALLFVSLSATGYAQVIPPSDDAAHIRERFTGPPAPLAQPTGASVQLESTTPPSQAAKLHLTITKIIVEGSTVYSPAKLAALGADIVGHEVSLQAVYELAAKIGGTFATVPDTKQLYYGAIDIKVVLNGEGLAYHFDPYYSGGKPGLPSLVALDYRSAAYGFESGLS